MSLGRRYDDKGLLVLFLLAIVLVPARAGSGVDPGRETNLMLANYSFEVEAGPNQPADWGFASGMPVTYGYVRNGTEGQDCFKGAHAITMSNPTGNNGRWYCSKHVPQGRSLLLAFWLKTENLASGVRFQPVIEWSQTGVGGKPATFCPAVITVQDWTLYSYTIQDPPAGADRAVVTLKFEAGSAGSSGKGTVYIDEIYFGEPPALDVTEVQIIPNPVRGGESISISYKLAEPSLLTISVYNLAGSKLAELFSGRQDFGSHQFSWDGKLRNNICLKKGLYILSVNAAGDGERAITNKLLYIID